MTPRLFLLAAALVGAMLAPVAAVAAPGAGGTPADARRAQSMVEARAIVRGLGLSCLVSDARFVGTRPADPRIGMPAARLYEIACGASAMGFFLMTMPDRPDRAISCIEVDTPQVGGRRPDQSCILPGNANPWTALAPAMARTGANCTPTAARGLGGTQAHTFLEVACKDGAGFIVTVSAPLDLAKEVQVSNCLYYDGVPGNIRCELGSHAARLAVIDRLVAGRLDCAVKDRRIVGMSKDGADFYEIACQNGQGYMIEAWLGAMTEHWDCAHAFNILGGCTLTAAAPVLQTEQNALYTRLVSKAGSDCDVIRYADFPQHGVDEVAELVCRGGASLIAIFPPNGKGRVVDCGQGLVLGYPCRLGKPDYRGVDADLERLEVTSCLVSDARLAGRTAAGTLLEVACADGQPGYVVEYRDTVAITAIACRLPGACQLPSNRDR